MSDIAVEPDSVHILVNSSAWQDSASERIETVIEECFFLSSRSPSTYSLLTVAGEQVGLGHWAPFVHQQSADPPAVAVLMASRDCRWMRESAGDGRSFHFPIAHAVFAAPFDYVSVADVAGVVAIVPVT